MLTLRYFGPFEVRRDGAEVTLPTRPCARLLALLGTEPGRRWRREAIAREIWPDAEYATETVSLRTALTMIRKVIGADVLGADRERVWVEAGAVTSDRERFGVLLRRESLEPDADQREESLAELVQSSPMFLEGWDAPWVMPLRAEHVRSVARVALDLSRIRLASGQYEEARQLALRSLVARPGNDHAIAIAVRAAVALGERDEALELAARGGASPELRRLAEEIERSPAATSPPPTVEAPDLLFDAFESNLREDPEGAVRFLMGNRSFWWRQREIVRAKTLLQLGLDAAPLSPSLRARTLHTLGMLHFRTADYGPTLEAGRQALALDPEPDLRNDIRMVRGATLLEMRCWEEAEAEIQDHLALLTTEPRDYRTNWVTMNHASLASNLLRFDEAQRYLDEAGENFIGDEFRRLYGEAHIRTGRAEMAAYDGDWILTARHADAAREVLTVRVDPFAAAIPNALALLARAAQGDAGVGPRLVGAPLDPVRSGMRRMAVVVFDFVAEGLAHLGRGDAATELLRANSHLREELGHDRSPLEQAFVERTETLARERRGPSVPPAPTGGYALLAAWTAARGDDL